MPRSSSPRSPRSPRRGSSIAGKQPPNYAAAFFAISDVATRWAARKRQEHGGALARRSIADRPWWTASSVSTVNSESLDSLAHTQLLFLLDDGPAGGKPAQLLPLYNSPPSTLVNAPSGALDVSPTFSDFVSLLSRLPQLWRRSDEER